MELKIAGHTLNKYDGCKVVLKYDSIASTFTFRVKYDEDNATHREIFRPSAYHRCEIWHRGVLVLTGIVLSPRMGESSKREWQDISGYSLTGVLNDNCIIDADDAVQVDEENQTAAIPDAPLEFSSLTLEEIAGRVIQRHGIALVVDDEVRKDPNFAVPFSKISIKPEQTIADLLNDLCRRKNILLSHTAKGELLMTRAKANAILTNDFSFVKTRPVDGEGQAYVESDGNISRERPILADYSAGGDIRMGLEFDGQAMHRVIQVVKQQSEESTMTGAPDGAAVNPYAPSNSLGLRFKRVVQTIGDQADVLPTARMLVGAELKEIRLTVTVQGWVAGGHLITPNQMITVRNPVIQLHKKHKWFIREVALEKDLVSEVATMECVPPEAFNTDKIVNIFDK